MPLAEALYELPGSFVNLEYQLPSGETVKFLHDKNLYLCTQIELADTGICCGVIADMSFILICNFGIDNTDPELILYKKR